MRLNCPGCGAQYEVEDSAIPDEGRDVQCSACGHGWFQYPPVTGSASPFGAPEPFGGQPLPLAPAALVEAQPEAPPRPKAETPVPRAPALDDIRAFLRQEAIRETEQRRKEGAPSPKPAATPAPPPQAAAPDPAAISSLRPMPEPRESGPGFSIGLFSTLVLALLAAGIYVSAPRLADALPELRDPLFRYVSSVDGARGMLSDFVRQVSAALRE